LLPKGDKQSCIQTRNPCSLGPVKRTIQTLDKTRNAGKQFKNLPPCCNGQVSKISHPKENHEKHGPPSKMSNSGLAPNIKKKPRLLSHRGPQDVMILKNSKGKALRIKSIHLLRLQQIDQKHKWALIKMSKNKENLSNKRQPCKLIKVNSKDQEIYFCRDKQRSRVLLGEEQEVLATVTVKTEARTNLM
jgi:hypothetical protein